MEPELFDQILAEVRGFVRAEVVSREAEIEDRDEIPAELRRRAAAMGLFGFALPSEYGGLGLTMAEDVQLAFELGYPTPAFRSLLATNNGLAGQAIAWAGTPEQRQRYLPRMATGEIIAAFGLTEPEAGSDAAALRTTATRDGDGYRLDGTKRYITNSPIADLFVIFARTAGEGADGISGFLLERDTPGLTVGPRDHKMGQAGAWTAEVFLDGATVPAGALLGGAEGHGFRTAMRSVARGRLHIAAICVGQAERLLHESIGYARQRCQFGSPIGQFQLVQAMLAESQVDCFAGRSMVLEAARRFRPDPDADNRLATSTCKLFCSEMLGRVADRAVQIHGGAGYIRGVPVERMFRDARVFRLYEGTSQLQQVIIGRQLVKSGPLG